MKGLFYQLESFFYKEKAFDLPHKLLEKSFKETEIQMMKKLGIFVLRGKEHIIVLHVKDPKEVNNDFGGRDGLRAEMTQFIDKLVGAPLEKASDIIVYDGIHVNFLKELKAWVDNPEKEIPESQIDLFAKGQFILRDLLGSFR